MMKLKLSLRNLARAALRILFIILLFSGCSSSTTATYQKLKIASSIKEICKNEYKIAVKVNLIGDTIWIYLPVEDIFIKADKPSKTTELFKIEKTENSFDKDLFKLDYAIKAVKPEEKIDDYKINPDISDKLGKAWQVIRRIIFSLEHSKNDEPKFYCMVVADIKNGFEFSAITYYLDIKKSSYNLLSNEEYQHRTVQNFNIDPNIIGDKDGKHVNYTDFSMKDFIIAQIEHRIKLKFQKPELTKKADIDKEILKIATHTINIYNYKDFGGIELKNLLTNKKILLNKAAVLFGPNE